MTDSCLQTDEKAGEKFEEDPRIFQLAVSREEETLRVSAFERRLNEEITIHDYEKVAVPMTAVSKRCNDLVTTLNEANRKGRVTREVLFRLREIGQMLYDDLFSPGIKEKLKHTDADYLRLSLDDRLIHIPWELLFDGDRFLCQRFCMGRLVSTGQKLPGMRYRKLRPPLEMLVLADPEKNLKGAYVEGTTIRDFMDRNPSLVRSALHSGNITVESIREKLRNFDVIHFAGHVDYSRREQKNSGWRLSNGLLRAEEIVKMAGSANMPSLVFSNACQSARTKEWKLANDFQDEICSLANAFLLGGVRHYMGTFWEIPDKPSVYFSLTFYRNLIHGMPIGMAIREARHELIQEFGEETIVWASYLLYGDPVTPYVGQSETGEKPQSNISEAESLSGNVTRSAKEEIISLSNQFEKASEKKRSLVRMTAVWVFLLSLGWFGYAAWRMDSRSRHGLDFPMEGEIHAPLQSGVITGGSLFGAADRLFRQGRMEDARQGYRRLMDQSGLSQNDRAEAFFRLGRIASIQNRRQEALALYDQAAKLLPDNERIIISKAMLHGQSGEYDLALSELEKARSQTPTDSIVKALAQEMTRKMTLLHDVQQQEYVDGLIDALIKQSKEGRARKQASPASAPETVWVMDFESSGYAYLEGEDRLIATGIVAALSENTNLEFVDRTILDKLLVELKLGNSTLTDQGVMLTIGRIMAARFIVTGRIVYGPEATMVSCRMVETETTRVKKAVSERFDRSATPDEIAKTISGRLRGALQKT